MHPFAKLRCPFESMASLEKINSSTIRFLSGLIKSRGTNLGNNAYISWLEESCSFMHRFLGPFCLTSKNDCNHSTQVTTSSYLIKSGLREAVRSTASSITECYGEISRSGYI